MRVTLAVLLLAACLSHRTPADDGTPATDEIQETARISKERVEKAVDDVKVFVDGQAEEPLRPEVVLRWQNPIRVQTGAAVFAIWPHNGRPEAMASVFVWNGDLCHEFGSLTRGEKLIARHSSGERLLREPGVEFKLVPDSDRPADMPAARLRQMRAIAERFTARLVDQTRNNENQEVLRLLAKPLYRYEIKTPGAGPLRLFDGGVFAYVMGTDPEVVLLLEAVGPENEAVWQYAFAIATTHAVEARLGDEVVWSRRGFGRGASNAEMFFRRPLAD
jgi:hypothetical protein